MLQRRKPPVASSKSRANGPDPFDVYVLRDSSTKIEGETAMTTGQVKGLFAEIIKDQHGLKRSDALKSISNVTAYVPVREEKIGDDWVPAKIDNDRDTMANVFSQHHTGLLLFQVTHGNSQVPEVKTLRDKETTWAASQMDLLERMVKMEEAFKAFKTELERSKAEAECSKAELEEAFKAEAERSKAELEEALKAEAKRSKAEAELWKADLEEALKAEAKRSKAEAELWKADLEEALKAEAKRSKAEAELWKAELEEALKAEAKRSKQMEEKLRADLETERARAQLAEENLAMASAAVEENIAEVNSFIANGSREDTDVFYRIKARHLISLV